MAKSGDPLSFDAISSTSSFRCINCSSPLPNYNNESIEDEEKESRVVVKALFSVFRLNFLDAFDSFEVQVAQEEENPIALCVTCRKVLVNIFDLYTEFCQLTKVDSYLSKKLLRLHEIIERHRKKTIHCDLIQGWEEQGTNFVDNSTSFQENEDDFPLQESPFIVEETDPLVTMDKPLVDNKTKSTVTFSCEMGVEEDREDTESDDDPDSRFVSPSDEEEIGIKVEFEYENCGDEADESEQEDNEDDQHPPEPEMKLEKDLSTGNNDDEHFLEMEPSTSSTTLSQAQAARVYEIKNKFKYLFRNKTRLAGSKSRSSSKIIAPYGVIPRPDPFQGGKKYVKSTTTRLNKSHIIRKEPNHHETGTTTRLNPTRISNRVPRYPIEQVEKIVCLPHAPVNSNKQYLLRKSKVPSPCWHCELDFTTPEECLQHTKNVHEKQFQNAHLCLDCSKISPTLYAFTSHKIFCEKIPCGKILPLERNFQCEKCPSKFMKMHQLQSHLDQVHSDVRPFVCELCSFSTKTMQLLNTHKKNKHDSEGRPTFCCEFCGKSLKYKSQLKRHLLVKHPQEGQEEERASLLAKEKAADEKKRKMRNKPAASTVCEDCQVDMFSRLALINHRLSVHQDNMDRNWVCEQCGRGFRNANGLNSHVQNVHVEDRKFTCHICGKSFKSKFHVKAHEERSHTEEGRLKYNQLMRQKNQRKKLRESLLAQLSQEKPENAQIDNDESSGDVN